MNIKTFFPFVGLFLAPRRFTRQHNIIEGKKIMDEIAPEFNSSLQYLWRISNMLWSAHTACMDETTKKDEYLILQQLDIELDPRMSPQERWMSEILRQNAKKLTQEPIREYFIFLNRIAHEKKLIMKDKDIGPAVVRNTR